MSNPNPTIDPARPVPTSAHSGGRLPRLIRLSSVALAMAGVVAFGTIIYSASGSRSVSPGEVPLITASTESMRERPADPGGMVVANRDSTVFDALDRTAPAAGIERLLPPPEAPMDQPQPVVGNVSPAVPSDMPSPRRPDGQPALTAAEIRLLHQQPEIALQPSGDAAVVAMNELAANATMPAGAAAISANPTALPMAVAQDVPARPTPKSADATMAEAAAPALQKIAPAAGPASRFVQLGAVKSREAAEAGLKKMQASYPQQLGDIPAAISKTEVPGKGTFWRMRAGPVSAAEASEICSSLKAAKVSCIVGK